MFKPFSSRDVLILLVAASLIAAGSGELVSARSRSNPWPARPFGMVLIVAGVAVLIWPDVTIGLLTRLVALGLMLGALIRVADSARGPQDRFVLIVSRLALRCSVASRSPGPISPSRISRLSSVRRRSFSESVRSPCTVWTRSQTPSHRRAAAPSAPLRSSGHRSRSKQAADSPRPVLAWTHGTTSVTGQCAPSLLTRRAPGTRRGASCAPLKQADAGHKTVVCGHSKEGHAAL